MDFTPSSTLLVPAGIAVLIGWRMYSRIRRMVGRQRLSKVRPWLTVVAVSAARPRSCCSARSPHPLGGRRARGGRGRRHCAGLLGTRLTKFEVTPAGLFYTPNAHLGIALSLLLVLRLGYRLCA